MTNRVTLEIAERVPFAEGQEFDGAGAYERLKGRARFAVDPSAPANAMVCDIDKAPVNADGLVEFAADVFIYRPVDPAKANRRVFYDYGNRGNQRAIQFFNDAPASNAPLTLAEAGNGFLFRRGYTFVCCAWQADLLPGDGRMMLDVPVATDNGAPLTGPVRAEFTPEAAGAVSFPLSGWINTRSHPAVSLDTTQATLTKRRYAGSERELIPADQWAFARVAGGIGLDGVARQSAVVPSDTDIHLPAGFEPGWIYELVYTAKDPLVMGLGHVAVRDFIAFLKHDGSDANPVGDIGMEKAYAWGRSQTGRAIRDFVYHGFNADAEGRKVFDGVLPHVAGGGLMWLNHRFANAVEPAGQEYENHDNGADRFPFAYCETTDHLTGRTDAIMKRPATDPLVFHSQTATEYWQRRGSLAHTDTQGNDLPDPEGVRFYAWVGSEHFADPNLKAPSRGICQNLSNVARTSMLFRALLDAMDAWATDGTPPPDSRVPRRADGTLVTADEWRAAFPAIPGVMLPSGPASLPLFDFGPEADAGLLTKLPPNVPDAAGYTLLVPACDADGNDVGGVRAPMVEAPLATYTGWNLRARGFGVGAKHKFTGSTIPFPETADERAATRDPRAAITERYADVQAYQAAIRAAAEALVADRLMLAEDVERCVRWAANWDRARHDLKAL
ncbi:MAG: alpha/beta hydrolase domain-containing protein [Rhodospirillaceae bacterium]